MTFGIYSYVDLSNGEIVYIGKDSNISQNSRHKDHLKPSRYNEQQINRVLQNNPSRYDYEVVCESKYYSNEYLNLLEKGLIKVFNPTFNYTLGGDGVCGYSPTSETREKISNSLKGKYVGEKHPMYGKNLSEEHKTKLSLSLKGRFKGEESHHYRQDVPPAKQLYLENKNGMTQRELAKKYNCSQTLIFGRIKSYKEEIGK